jgi:hypothetical protein
MLSMKLDYLLNQRPALLPSTVSSRWLPNSSALTSAVSLYLWMRSSHAVRTPKAVWAKLADLMASGNPSSPGAYTRRGLPTAIVFGGTKNSLGTFVLACTSAPTATTAPELTVAPCRTVAPVAT